MDYIKYLDQLVVMNLISKLQYLNYLEEFIYEQKQKSEEREQEA